MAKGDPPTSPWLFYDSGEDYQGKHITATVTFSGTITPGSDQSTWTNPLTGATVTRDAGCVYTKILIGTGAGTKTIDCSGFTGSHSFTANQLASVGLHTVADIAGLQITASP